MIGSGSLAILLSARNRIKRSQGALKGRNLVTIGLIIAGLGTVLMVLSMMVGRCGVAQ